MEHLEDMSPDTSGVKLTKHGGGTVMLWGCFALVA